MAKALRQGVTTKVVWALMVLLILGLGGFGVTNFGAATQGIGSVGGREIDAGDYARALNAEMRAISAQIGTPLSFAQAQGFGLDTLVRERLVAETALEGEAARIGLAAGDAEVREQILAIPAFHGPTGQFDRDAYALALRQQGLTEARFEARLRDGTARTFLQGAVAAGIAEPQGYGALIARWAAERRSFRYLRLDAATQPGAVPPPPTEAELAAFHAATPAPFTTPETRVVSYARLTPEMLLDEVQVDEAALRAEYDRRLGEFVQPERRLVERLVFATGAEAEAARAAIAAGSASFESLAAERGLTLADIDLGEVSEADLGAAGAAVFALTETGVAGPVATDLGPALFSMNGILEAQSTSFDEARPALAEEVAIDRARRMVAERAPGIEDLIAGGATLEDLGREAGMELGTAEVTADGEGEGIAGYAAFRAAALKAAVGDFPELAELDDGGLFALRLDEIRPPRLKPLDEVRDEAVRLWTGAETGRRLLAEAEAIAAEADFDAAAGARGLVPVAAGPMTRDGFVEGLPEAALPRVFALAEGAGAAVGGDGAAFVLHLDRIEIPAIAAPGDTPAPAEAEATDLARRVGADAAQGIAQDLLGAYVQAVAAGAGVRIDPAAVAAVHARMQ